ncbi:MAG: glutamate--tRNA ligase [Alphaproteobacteria bacterium]|nr:glutamate--tRNA ligase [Alphaproteobacteria bacterium]
MSRVGLSPDLIARVLQRPADWTQKSLEQLEIDYPDRQLGEGAMVTRFAPSPTGFMHIGGLYQVLLNKKLAQQSGGVFYLRIEDTDTAREVAGATKIIIDSLEKFRLEPDEGISMTNEFDETKSELRIISTGDYGPYVQSMRKDIYHSVAAELLAGGKAYPCFMTADEMNEIRESQAKNKIRPGIYGEFARNRNLTADEITAKLDAGLVPSIRLYSPGVDEKKVYCKDEIRGSIEFPENTDDIVIIKSNDGLPTYHFAHLCDDYFMRTTHVIRAEEWLSSFPVHKQLFDMMGWQSPKYAHTSTLDTIDAETGNQRKLSKRHDPMSSVDFFIKNGYPTEAVLEYLYNILNSSYEEDKTKGKVNNIWEHEFRLKKIPTSGALFDMKKLEWWAKEHISKMNEANLEITNAVFAWAQLYSPEWYNIIKKGGTDYLHNILNIERDNPKHIRKDFITWSQTLSEIEYFFDDKFVSPDMTDEDKKIFSEFLNSFDIKDQKDIWWSKIVAIAEKMGVKNGDVAMALRVALTGRTMAPDLYSVMQVMGSDRVQSRIQKILDNRE